MSTAQVISSPTTRTATGPSAPARRDGGPPGPARRTSDVRSTSRTGATDRSRPTRAPSAAATVITGVGRPAGRAARSGLAPVGRIGRWADAVDDAQADRREDVGVPHQPGDVVDAQPAERRLHAAVGVADLVPAVESANVGTIGRASFAAALVRGPLRCAWKRPTTASGDVATWMRSPGPCAVDPRRVDAGDEALAAVARRHVVEDIDGPRQPGDVDRGGARPSTATSRATCRRSRRRGGRPRRPSAAGAPVPRRPIGVALLPLVRHVVVDAAVVDDDLLDGGREAGSLGVVLPAEVEGAGCPVGMTRGGRRPGGRPSTGRRTASGSTPGAEAAPVARDEAGREEDGVHRTGGRSCRTRGARR